MQKLTVFNHISLDGYFTDAQGGMDFARDGQPDAEWEAFVAGNASNPGGAMLFGRVTYEMMASWWPTPEAIRQMPVVAGRMNSAPKVVFSRTLKRANWNNTRLVKDDLPGTVRKMKAGPGEGLLIFGSGSIVSQLAQAGLIDEYQLILNPVVLGAGRSMFAGLPEKLPLQLVQARPFLNGKVLLTYRLLDETGAGMKRVKSA
jgi:dihydrofolate reductase